MSRFTKLKLEILRTSSNFILFSRGFRAEIYVPYFYFEYFVDMKGARIFYLTEVIPLSAFSTSGNLKSYYERRNRNFYANNSWYHLVRFGRKINVF